MNRFRMNALILGMIYVMLFSFVVACPMSNEESADEDISKQAGKGDEASGNESSIKALQTKLDNALADGLVTSDEAHTMFRFEDISEAPVARALIMRTFLEQTLPRNGKQADMLEPEAREWLETIYKAMLVFLEPTTPLGNPPLLTTYTESVIKSVPDADLVKYIHFIYASTIPAIVNGKLDWTDTSFKFVKQGLVEDCYFLSTIAAIARMHPQVIQNMFTWNDQGTITITFPGLTTEKFNTLKDQQTGKYYLSLREIANDVIVVDEKGAHVEISLDLPVMTMGDETEKGNEELLYAQTVPLADVNRKSTLTGGHELWPAYLEKAYAKLLGGYGAIEGGNADQYVFPLFFNWEHRRVDLFDAWRDSAVATKVFYILQEGEPAKGRFVMTASTFGMKMEHHGEVPNPEAYAKIGLVDHHEYMVLGAFQKGAQRYVILQNPHREIEPSKEQGNTAAAKNDGLFNLKFEDFILFFGTVNIALPPPKTDSPEEKARYEANCKALKEIPSN